MNNSALSGFTALALKVVAVILILSSLLDYIILLIPFKPLDQQWQIAFTNQIVDRGIIPMVGITFLLVGYWIGSATDAPGRAKSAFLDLRFWAFSLASVLGLVFLLLVPLHISNLGRAVSDRISEIDQQATVAEGRIEQQSAQMDSLLADEQRLKEIDEAIEKGEVQGQKLQPAQLQQLQQVREQILSLRQDPAALKAEIEKAQTQVRDQKLKLKQQANTEATKNGVRISISSLLLAIGYMAIGWMGFKGLGGANTGRRRVSVK